MQTFLYAPLKTITELGEEKRCLTCGEYWPADTEFFESQASSRDGLTPRCIACIRARLWDFIRPSHHYCG